MKKFIKIVSVIYVLPIFVATIILSIIIGCISQMITGDVLWIQVIAAISSTLFTVALTLVIGVYVQWMIEEKVNDKVANVWKVRGFAKAVRKVREDGGVWVRISREGDFVDYCHERSISVGGGAISENCRKRYFYNNK